MGYENFSAKVDWDHATPDTECAFTMRFSLCCPVTFVYYLGREKHAQDYMIDCNTCTALEHNRVTARHVLESIKEYEALG